MRRIEGAKHCVDSSTSCLPEENYETTMVVVEMKKLMHFVDFRLE